MLHRMFGISSRKLLRSYRHVGSSAINTAIYWSSIRAVRTVSQQNAVKLEGHITSKNADALKLELAKLARGNYSSKGHSQKKAPKITNFPAIAAQICVSDTNVDFDMAFDMFECLDQSSPNSMLLGIYELIDKCLERKHVDEAMLAYKRLHNMGRVLDLAGKQRLLKALCADCRVDNVLLLIGNSAVSEDDLVLIADPLIMSGCVREYAELLRRFVLLQRGPDNSMQSPDKVARVLRSVLAARLKRYCSRSYSNYTVRSLELVGMRMIFIAMQRYHLQLPMKPNHDVLSESPSYLVLWQLYKAETSVARLHRLKLDESHAHAVPPEDIDFLVDISYSFDGVSGIEEEGEIQGENGQGKVDAAGEGGKTAGGNSSSSKHAGGFDYIVENDGTPHPPTPNHSDIRDLTTELKLRGHPRILLYRKDLFPRIHRQEELHRSAPSITQYFVLKNYTGASNSAASTALYCDIDALDETMKNAEVASEEDEQELQSNEGDKSTS